MKPKQNKITFTSIEKIWDVFSMRQVTGRQTEQKGAKFRNN